MMRLKIRDDGKVILQLKKPESKKGFDFNERAGGSGKRRKNYTWSKMLARVFKIDVLKCERCGGKLRPICAVTESDSIRRYLKSNTENDDSIPTWSD